MITASVLTQVLLQLLYCHVCSACVVCFSDEDFLTRDVVFNWVQAHANAFYAGRECTEMLGGGFKVLTVRLYVPLGTCPCTCLQSWKQAGLDCSEAAYVSANLRMSCSRSWQHAFARLSSSIEAKESKLHKLEVQERDAGRSIGSATEAEAKLRKKTM